MSWDASDEDTWERWDAERRLRRAVERGVDRACAIIAATREAGAREAGCRSGAGETVAARSEGREAPSLNRWGRCVACDQPLGHNPNRCCVCATAYDKEHA
jgi:hypothetical protein